MKIPPIGPTVFATAPTEVHQKQSSPQASHASTLSSMSSSMLVSDCLKNGWNAITSFIRSLFDRFFGAMPLSPSQRENRLDKDPRAIHRSLAVEMRLCAEQMAKESAKSFRYLTCDPLFQMSSAENRIGNMRVGVAHAQGRRPSMEDAHLATAFNLEVDGRIYPVQLFGIFDGHGGPAAAHYVRDHLRQELQEALMEFNRNGLTEEGIWKALKRACTRLDSNFKDLYPQVDSFKQGTTATFAMVLNNHLWTANVGDSRTILDNHGRPEQLSCDAKPDDSRFRRGIENRGGKVVNVFGVPRINGNLAVARGIGDHGLNGAVSARPKITVKPLSEIQDGSQLILCCDGVFEVARTVDLVNAAHANRFLPPAEIARNFVYSAYEAGSGDNLSAMVVKLK